MWSVLYWQKSESPICLRRVSEHGTVRTLRSSPVITFSHSLVELPWSEHMIFMNHSFLISKMKMFNCWVVSDIFLTLLFALVNPVFFKFLCYQIVCNSSLLSYFLMKGICKCLSEPLFCLRHPWYSVNKILAHNWKKSNFRLATLAIPDRLYNMDYEASWSSGVPMTWHCSGTSGLY